MPSLFDRDLARPFTPDVSLHHLGQKPLFTASQTAYGRHPHKDGITITIKTHHVSTRGTSLSESTSRRPGTTGRREKLSLAPKVAQPPQSASSHRRDVWNGPGTFLPCSDRLVPVKGRHPILFIPLPIVRRHDQEVGQWSPGDLIWYNMYCSPKVSLSLLVLSVYQDRFTLSIRYEHRLLCGVKSHALATALYLFQCLNTCSIRPSIAPIPVTLRRLGETVCASRGGSASR